MARRQTLREKIEARIAERGDNAFLTREFRDFAGERQVIRALSQLTRDGKLIRLGYGVYGRTVISSLTQKPMLGNGFLTVARQALEKLGVPWELTEAQCAYNEGRSTQVPVNPAVRVKSRFTRKLSYQNSALRVDR